MINRTKELIKKLFSGDIAKNSMWLMLDRAIAIVSGFIVYLLAARLYGPESFGVFNFAQSILALVSAFGLLGVDSLLVRDLVRGELPERDMMGTVFWMRIAGSVLLTLVGVVSVIILGKEDTGLLLIVAILSTGYFVRSTEVIFSWFLSKTNSKPTAIARVIAILIVFVLKVWAIVNQKSIALYAFFTVSEFYIMAIGYVYVYIKNQGLDGLRWKWNNIYFVRVIKEGWVLFVTALLTSFAQRIDQYLIGVFLGEKSVGLYSPAVKFAEIWYFLPVTIIDSFYPTLVSAKNRGQEYFDKRFKQAMSIVLWLSFIAIAGISVLAPIIVRVFLGEEYIETANVLRIYVWSSISLVLGVMWIRWMLIEKKTKKVIIYQIVNVVVNLSLNLYVIPKYGIVGAAWVSVLSYTAGILVASLSYDPRYIWRVILSSVVYPFKIVKNTITSNK